MVKQINYDCICVHSLHIIGLKYAHSCTAALNLFSMGVACETDTSQIHITTFSTHQFYSIENNFFFYI